MASPRTASGLPGNFILTPAQQTLLLAALNSNKQSNGSSNGNGITPPSNPMTMSPSSAQTSPMQSNDAGVFQESPFLDYDYSYNPDSSFDFDFAGDQPSMIGDLPGTESSQSPEAEAHEKRSHPDDDDADDDRRDGKSDGNGAKRRESTEKVAKKPGRKPLTSEPSSKRKAQNRAAQRAFRERKEKHLKDLETKVEELEKESKETSTENAALKARIERMTTELNEYKQRLSLMSSTRSVSGSKQSRGFGAAAVTNLNDVNFHFEFPKFGMLPGPPLNKSSPASPQSNGSTSKPLEQSFTESFLNANGSSPFGNGITSVNTGASRTSVDSGHFSLGAGNTSSPSASSHSNVGASSSCGTSPEPLTQSPMTFKPVDTMTTIGEENHSLPAHGQNTFDQFSGIDVSSTSFDWLAHQNGGQFEPQLFGDYREPQDNILNKGTFDDNFFNDTLDADFFTPYYAPPAQPQPQKKSLIAKIDEAKNADDDIAPAPAKSGDKSCTKLWDKLQDCPKVLRGEVDMDSLCAELTKKATCNGHGPEVSDKDFEKVVKKYLGPDMCKGEKAKAAQDAASLEAKKQGNPQLSPNNMTTAL